MGSEVVAAGPSDLPSAMQSMPEWLRQLAERCGSERYSTELTASPKAIEAARAALPAACDALAGATETQRAGLLVSLLEHCVVASDHVLKSGDAVLIGLYWSAFHEDLSHVPAAILQAACKTVRSRPLPAKSVRWFPAPGDLLAICAADERWKRAAAIRHGLWRLAKATPERPREPLSEAEQAEVEAKMAMLRARAAASCEVP